LQVFSKSLQKEARTMREILLAVMIFLILPLPAFSKKVDEKACLEAFNGLTEIIAKNLNKSYKELTEKEQKNFRKYLDYLVFHRKRVDFILDRMDIPHSRFDWWCTWRVARDPLCKIKKDRFTLILFPGDRLKAPIIKKIYGNSIDVKVFWSTDAPGMNINKILKKLEKERKKQFCYLWYESGRDIYDTGRHIISCPSFHLEKDFVPIVENNCKKVVSGKGYCGYYEFVRNIILWMNKEFGRRGIIPNISTINPR